ncbi:hypothetical protein MTO96_035835 [Rhipicephalus appendiculatus]
MRVSLQFYKPFALPGLRNAKWGDQTSCFPGSSYRNIKATIVTSFNSSIEIAGREQDVLRSLVPDRKDQPRSSTCTTYGLRLHEKSRHLPTPLHIPASAERVFLVDILNTASSEVSRRTALLPAGAQLRSLNGPLLGDLQCLALPIFALGTLKGRSHWSSSPCSMEDYFPQEAVFRLPANANRILVDFCFKMCTDSRKHIYIE